MSKEINVPSEWKKIDENSYSKIGVVNNEEVKCLGSYMVEGKDEGFVVSFYDYSKHDEEFLKILDNLYSEVDLNNKIIDGNTKAEGYSNSSFMNVIYHGFVNKDKGLWYVSIIKVAGNKSYVYKTQVFTKGNAGIYCVDASVESIDENNPVNSIFDIPYVKSAIKCLNEIASK